MRRQSDGITLDGASRRVTIDSGIRVRQAQLTDAGRAACLWIGLCVAWMTNAFGEVPSPMADHSGEKTALAAFNGLIGQWRGAGQVRRGSNRGAWAESAAWIWDFEDGVAIVCDVEGGKHLKSARLTYDAESKLYRLVAELPDDTRRKYVGEITRDKLILESVPDEADMLFRLTLTQLNEKRTLVLFEKRRAVQKSWQRIAEVGYTRKGTRLADNDSSGPECVVTGGLGTITVAYNGKTYYVCCSGCKQAFDADPEGVLAEYAERQREESEKNQ